MQNQTLITNQDYPIYCVYSTLSIDGLVIKDSEVETPLILVTESTVLANNLETRDLISQSKGVQVLLISYSSPILSQLSHYDSNLKLAELLYWEGTISGIISSNVESNSLISLRQTNLTEMSDFNVITMKSWGTTSIQIQDSRILRLVDHSYDEVNQTAIYASNSWIGNIENVSILNSKAGISLFQSAIDLVTNMTINNWGGSESLKSGGIYSKSSNISISNSIFMNNKASVGAGLYVDCEVPNFCHTSISNSSFSNNTATVKGGAIFYNLQRPIMTNNIFSNNKAEYGKNIASYATRIVELGTLSNKLMLDNAISGIRLLDKTEANTKTLTLAVIDEDNQVMNIESGSAIFIEPYTLNYQVLGTSFAKTTNGIANLEGIIFVASPGLKDIEFKIDSNLLDKEQIKYGLSNINNNAEHYENKVTVTFRNCKPGEYVSTNKWVEWAPGSFSLDWSSTKCESWMKHAEWLGSAQIHVDKEYWRDNQNSTKLIKCLRGEACKGGYEPENEHPVKCKKGYKGHLWATWDIVDGHKYQSQPGFQCLKCPHPVLNIFRVLGVLLLIVLFMIATIIINIRKSKDNQFSILTKIFTNYIQLISLWLSFGISVPNSFSKIFSLSKYLGTGNEAFFSFDCFIEDTEIRAFAPSNTLFKTFLFSLLPLALILVIFLIIFIVTWIIRAFNKNKKLDLKRYFAISTICIIFLLHPSLTLESLRLFQCIQIDDGEFRMRSHMEYKCFSFQHLTWALGVGLPMLIVWVIGVPSIALFFLIKHRTELEDMKIKKYLLLIYQGLKHKAFYWEFVNTSRKILMLCCIVFLSPFPTFYGVMFATCK